MAITILPAQLLIGENIYGLDLQANFWRYDLTTDELQIVAELDKDTTYVTDIKGDKILATKFIGGRRELVEYSQR